MTIIIIRFREIWKVSKLNVEADSFHNNSSNLKQQLIIDSLEKCLESTWYGSQLLEGLLSSRYPYPCSATSLGILMLHPLLATPAEKSWMLLVS